MVQYIDPELPLIDLHRHLDGSVRLETILDVGLAHNLPLPATDVASLRPYVQVDKPVNGILAFFEKFKWQTGILVNYDVCRRVAYENVEDAKREGIDYIELRFSPVFMAEPFGLDPAGVVEAVIDGTKAGQRDFNLRANLIGIISRTYGVEVGFQELAALLQFEDDIVALDLAGDEVNFPAALFVEHFQRAREVGWGITVHAGEAGGAESIWQALSLLKATRIGHCIRAVDDPNLMEHLVTNEIGVESSLTSNVQTTSVASYEAHPLKALLEYGIKATINTDDPGISGNDLPSEYRWAFTKAGLSQKQIRQAQQNALELAFLTPADRAFITA